VAVAAKSNSAKNSEVITVKSGNLSAADLEAEIAAMANALGEIKTVNGAPVRKPSRRKLPLKPQTTSDKKTKVKKPVSAKSVDSTEEKGERITVKVSKPKVVRTVSQPLDKKPSSSNDPKIINHSGKKMVRPISEIKHEDDSKNQPAHPETEKAPRAVKVSLDASSTSVEVHHPQEDKNVAKPAAESQESEPKDPETAMRPVRNEPETTMSDDNPEAEEKPAVNISSAKPAQTKREKKLRHVARIYDTHTYHMPIEVNYHHRKALLPRWGRIVMYLAAIAGMLGYAFFSGMI
jgi:hypothetical protein